MQTILGSGGAIGVELAKVLTAYTDQIRLVSRKPKRINETDELMAANLHDEAAIDRAIKGSEIVYVTVGFEYKAKVWEKQWPPFIKSVIKACIKYKAKLVFFDNIYMYNPQYISNMTEATPIGPTSKKGKVRAELVELIMTAVKANQLEALIARSADFYGPNITRNSMLNEMVIKPLSQGKKASWLGGANFKHSFTYTPDAAKATALLGNTPSAYNQVWHLPTASQALTGKGWIEQAAKHLGKPVKYQVAPKFLVRIMGWFMPVMKEIVEMTYQYEQDYIFNSDKFNRAFDFKPTSYEEGLKQTVLQDYQN